MMFPQTNWRAVCSLAGVLLGAGMTFAQPPKPDAPAGDPLAGPKVNQAGEARKLTLVNRDMSGKLERLDVRPERAAVDLLKPTGEAKAAVDKVFSERAAAVSKLLYDNIDLYNQIQSVMQSRQREKLQPLLREFRPLAVGLLEPALSDKVATTLPTEQAAEFKRLVKEYVEALAAEEPEGGGGAPDGQQPARRRPPPGGETARVEMNLLLREVGQTLRTLVQERQARTDELVKAADATPEQEEQIRKIVREVGEKGGVRGTPETRGEMMKRIMDLLKPEQREKLRAYLRAGDGPRGNPEKKPEPKNVKPGGG